MSLDSASELTEPFDLLSAERNRQPSPGAATQQKKDVKSSRIETLERHCKHAFLMPDSPSTGSTYSAADVGSTCCTFFLAFLECRGLDAIIRL
jgi:hypothetical protein